MTSASPEGAAVPELGWIDTHAHVDHPRFDDDREEALARARAAGVVKIVNVGYNAVSIRTTLALAEAYPFVFAAIGWHPTEVASFGDGEERELRRLLAHPKVVALGEIGLDYHWDTVPPAVQQEAFRRQIRLAREMGLPIVVHDRDAHDDVLRILEEEGAEEVGGILHAFSGDALHAERGLTLGFALGFGGVVTFRKAAQRDLLPRVPLDRIVLETDSPYLTPHPHRGKRNEPAYVAIVGQAVAELLGLSEAEIRRRTFCNAHRVLPRLAQTAAHLGHLCEDPHTTEGG
ncbi:MAG: putative deoxyribonuclease YcfH [Brockia lithotrophica]|uniref:Putative deoxyribonuclease YcfH n=1 Tax=Brockia lithotrophica TaxID=933949 RepID=A0A2T5G588_9BACL|nr:MAG: putative deoxyribonuclease YcfH [Brockia lithotrophica]